MWYKVDHKKLTAMLTPISLRRPIFLSFLMLAAEQLQPISDLFVVRREKNIYRVLHTGQVCYLRAALNDAFDPIERRIKIGDRYENERVYIFTSAEEKPHHIYTTEELENGAEPTYLFNDAELEGTSADFKVLVPEALVYNQAEMHAMINYYKLAGKSYVIETYI